MLKEPIRIEIDPEDYTDQYDDMLDEVEGEFMGMKASYILKEMDSIAYRCGLLDYLDSQGIGDEKWECPICGNEFDDEDEAKYCCQDEEDEEEVELDE